MIITNSDNQGRLSDPSLAGNPRQKSMRRLLIIGVIIFTLLLLAAASLLWLLPKRNQLLVPVTPLTATTSSPGFLPGLEVAANASSTGENIALADIPIEYLTFSDFYKAPDNSFVSGFSDYELPLNVKIDIRNYNDVARKINLDPALDSLNTNGFALIDNPWKSEAGDFYSLYAKLSDKQISPFVSSDFILYYYQLMSKKIFKDIEENIFYENLWAIVQELYGASKTRYEARLASIGNVNDSILEGERLETAFFAVALELLKPANGQVAGADKLDASGKFQASESDKFYFVVPPYLREDVLREVELIRGAKGALKSPVLRYQQDYSEFRVPRDYQGNAKLNNFYLTTRWLNSVFPLGYRDSSCRQCLLDREDWRLGMIAASFISSDFSNLTQTKSQWARIYKVMSYFKSLREDLNYVNYRDASRALFGEDYDVAVLFDDDNPEAKDNLEKLRASLEKVEFSPFLGALDRQEEEANSRRGFKMMSEDYSPNDYIFKNLSYPQTGLYGGGNKAGKNNVTACWVNLSFNRCNGFALDVINLIQPLSGLVYFDENTNYASYQEAAAALRNKLSDDSVWQSSRYWSTLAALSAYLNTDRTQLPLLNQSTAWRSRSIDTAAAAWINMQLPLPAFSANQNSGGRSFDELTTDDSPYIETNLALVNELLAENSIMSQMLSALQISQNVVPVADALQDIDDNLVFMKNIILKELGGQELDDSDRAAIATFTKQFSIKESANSDVLYLEASHGQKSLKEDLSELKLMIIAHQDGLDRIFSVGPVWSYKESH